MAVTSRFKLGTVLTMAGVAVAVTAWALARQDQAVETSVVKRGNVEENVAAVGTLQPSSYVEVGAQVSGQIRSIYVKPGDSVEKGKLLAEIDPSVQQAEVDASRAALAGLKAQLAEQRALVTLARQQFERQRQMEQEGSTREEDVQTAHATLLAGEARIENLQAQIEQTQSTLKGDLARLGFTRIFAPMAGTVVSLDAREGQTLNASQQAPVILRIADLGTMTVWTEVSEADIKRIRPGMPVYFTTLGMEERTWNGTVRQILPAPPTPAGSSSQSSGGGSQASTAATGKVVLYTVLFDVENLDGELMPQMTAQVFFVIAKAENALIAPMAALDPVAGKRGHYIARIRNRAGAVDSREVQIGASDRVIGEVLAGLSEGEALVLE